MRIFFVMKYFDLEMVFYIKLPLLSLTVTRVISNDQTDLISINIIGTPFQIIEKFFETFYFQVKPVGLIPAKWRERIRKITSVFAFLNKSKSCRSKYENRDQYYKTDFAVTQLL